MCVSPNGPASPLFPLAMFFVVGRLCFSPEYFGNDTFENCADLALVDADMLAASQVDSALRSRQSKTFSLRSPSPWPFTGNLLF